MTEQPDTTKVRALGQLSMTFPELRSVVFALCDALDAARAANAIDGPTQLARAEAAEARIAAVEALCDKAERRVYQNDWWLNTCDIRRALTEGTGQ